MGRDFINSINEESSAQPKGTLIIIMVVTKTF